MEDIISKFPENYELLLYLKEYFDIKNIKLEKNDTYNSTIYNFLTKKITISDKQGNNENRIIVLIHECIHAKQNLVFHILNFIFANIEIVLFAIMLILMCFNKFSIIMKVIYLICAIASICVRTYMEHEAVTKSLSEFRKISTKYITEEEEKILYNHYKEVMDKYNFLFYFQLNVGKVLRIILTLLLF